MGILEPIPRSWAVAPWTDGHAQKGLVHVMHQSQFLI